ncbi:hypothetical protein HK102_010484 [Quaeritorhiza haematococci]|nr:hypothetical protein HK102_010484 [Quaeritorhiza haematococci]
MLMVSHWHIISGIAILNFNRPAVKNAIGRNFLNQFLEALDKLRVNRQVRVVILRSTVDGVFCAGADLKERSTMPQEEVDGFVHGLRTAFSNFASLPMPTIAAIDGFALGGGLEVAMAADFRVAGPKAKLGLPETKLAIIPGAGGTQRLPRLVGISKAKELIFTGKILSPSEAHQIGLVDHTSDGSAYDKALELARQIIPQGPVAIRMAKTAIDKGAELDISSGLALEQTCYANIIPTKDRLEGKRRSTDEKNDTLSRGNDAQRPCMPHLGLQAFKEKRVPVYKGE